MYRVSLVFDSLFAGTNFDRESYLNMNGCEEEGLYRVPGSSKDVKLWQKRFDIGNVTILVMSISRLTVHF